MGKLSTANKYKRRRAKITTSFTTIIFSNIDADTSYKNTYRSMYSYVNNSYSFMIDGILIIISK